MGKDARKLTHTDRRRAAEIRYLAAFACGTTADEMGERSVFHVNRDPRNLLARRVAAFLIRRHLGLSYPTIAAAVGWASWAPVLAGIRWTTEEAMRGDGPAAEAIQYVEAKLEWIRAEARVA